MPHASIITRTAQQVGGSFGSAVLAVILAMGLDRAGGDAAAQMAAYAAAFRWAIGFMVIAAVVALALPSRSAAR